MRTVRIAITLERDVAREIKSMAGESLSTWMANAAIDKLRSYQVMSSLVGWKPEPDRAESDVRLLRDRLRSLRSERLLAVVAAWEAAHGKITKKELAAARREIANAGLGKKHRKRGRKR